VVLTDVAERYLGRKESYAVHRISPLVHTLPGTGAEGEAMKLLLQAKWVIRKLENLKSSDFLAKNETFHEITSLLRGSWVCKRLFTHKKMLLLEKTIEKMKKQRKTCKNKYPGTSRNQSGWESRT
jgi:hypothetical protein